MPVWIVNQTTRPLDPDLGDDRYMLRLHSAYALTAVTNLASNPSLRSGAWANVALHVVVTQMPGWITGGSYPLTSIIAAASALSPAMPVYPGFIADGTGGTPKRYWSAWIDRSHWEQMAANVDALYPYVPSGRREMMFDIEAYSITAGVGGPHRNATSAAITYYQSNTYCNPAGTGTTPPAVTITGTAGAAYAGQTLVIDIESGGARGAATFRWSTDAGATWTASGVATDATVALGATGLTAAFAAGTYNENNEYRGIIVGPYPSLSEADVRAAMKPFTDKIRELNIRPCVYPHEVSIGLSAILDAADGYGEVWGESSFGADRYYVQNRVWWDEAVHESLWEVGTEILAAYPRAEVRYVMNDDLLRAWHQQTAVESACGRLRPWIFDNTRTDQASWATASWYAGTTLSTLNDVAHACFMRANANDHLPWQKTTLGADHRARFWKLNAASSVTWSESIRAHPDGVMLTRPPGAAATDLPTLRIYSADVSPYSVLVASPGAALTWTIDFTCVLPVGFDAGGVEGVLCAINGENLDVAQVMVRGGHIDLRLNNAGVYTYYRIVTGVAANTEYRIVFGRNGNTEWRHGASKSTAAFTAITTATVVNFGGGYDASNNPKALGVSSSETMGGYTFCLLLKRGVHIWHRALTDDEVTWLLADYTRFYPFGVAPGLV